MRDFTFFELSSVKIHPRVKVKVKVNVKERIDGIVLHEIHPRTTGHHLSMGTQCYLLPNRGDRPAFTPTGQVGSRFIDPVRMKGWVGLVGWLVVTYRNGLPIHRRSHILLLNRVWRSATTLIEANALPFLSRVSILTRDIYIANLSVRPSVRLSVRPIRSGTIWKRLNISS